MAALIWLLCLTTRHRRERPLQQPTVTQSQQRPRFLMSSLLHRNSPNPSPTWRAASLTAAAAATGRFRHPMPRPPPSPQGGPIISSNPSSQQSNRPRRIVVCGIAARRKQFQFTRRLCSGPRSPAGPPRELPVVSLLFLPLPRLAAAAPPVALSPPTATQRPPTPQLLRSQRPRLAAFQQLLLHCRWLPPPRLRPLPVRLAVSREGMAAWLPI